MQSRGNAIERLDYRLRSLGYQIRMRSNLMRNQGNLMKGLANLMQSPERRVVIYVALLSHRDCNVRLPKDVSVKSAQKTCAQTRSQRKVQLEKS